MCGIDVELVTHNDAAAQVSRASVMTAQHSLLRRRGPDSVSEHTIHGMGYALRMAGSVLSMRGHEVVSQPIIDPGGNALLWNGEIFGGSVPVPPGASDSQCLSAALARASSIPEVMSSVHGPWAFAYWHAASRTLWYGRDPLGRRSLLRIEDVAGRSLRLSSVAPLLPFSSSAPREETREPAVSADALVSSSDAVSWEELPADGIFSVRVLKSGALESAYHPVAPHPPPMKLDSALSRLGRSSLGEMDPGPETGKADEAPSPGEVWEEEAVREGAAAAARLLSILSDAVRRRVCDVPASSAPLVDGGRFDAAKTARPSGLHLDSSPILAEKEAEAAVSYVTTSARVGVLFSGGIDCMVLARLADLHLPPGEPIDLINVAFGALAEEAPDRLTARLGASELRQISSRTFNLIEVSVSLSELQAARVHLLRVLHPSSTVMDLNIGASFWFGARGRGVLRKGGEGGEGGEGSEGGEGGEGAVCRYANVAGGVGRGGGAGGGAVGGAGSGRTVPTPCLRVRIALGSRRPSDRQPQQQQQQASAVNAQLIVTPLASASGGQEAPGTPANEEVRHYRSGARVLLLGSGADEQLGGYGRHRTVFRKEGWAGLATEIHAECERLWLRNLGRDDRVISDWGREARHPYLDESVMDLLRATPLHHVTDLRRPLGDGDKLILRRAARMIGLTRCTALQKRAIQFGTRIANKNVCGQALLDDSVDLASVVHPEAVARAPPCPQGGGRRARARAGGVAQQQAPADSSTQVAAGAEPCAEQARGTGSAATRRHGGKDASSSCLPRRGDSALPERLSKKRGTWASARAAQPVP